VNTQYAANNILVDPDAESLKFMPNNVTARIALQSQ
jgi:hypothetical protein